ncbi:MAG: O-antigen ligase family protein [Deltaproteobacteria bacterium]|jgi:O-antigen ligase|nr:O-antigen ligase family protein [Deltaproteobacteria bacterium]
MKIILIYFLLFTFYIDQVMGAVGFSHMLKGLSLFNLNLYLLLIVWLLAIVQRPKMFMPNNINKLLILMGLVVLMSIFVKILRGEIPDISIMNEVLGFKAWLNPVLLFFILFNIVDDEETCNQALLGLYFLFLALILTQLLATFGITGYKAESIVQHGRAGGFSAAGVYAVSLVLFFPFVLSGSVLMKRGNLFKIGCITLVFLILMGLVNAGSRNGAVAFLCSMLVYLLILKRKKIMGLLPIIFLIITMIVVGATAFVVSPSSVKTVVSERFDPSTSEDLSAYSSGRTELWKNGWKLFVDSPLIGHGRNSFMILSQLRGYRYYGVPHNEYLRVLAEHGLIGLIVFLLIFFRIFQNIWQSLETTTDPWGKQLYISYIAGFCGFMVGMFATNMGSAMYLFWIYTAVIYKYAQLDMDKKVISEGTREAAANPFPLSQ